MNNDAERCYHKILETIFSSLPEDWHYDDDDGIFTYDTDALLQIRKDRESDSRIFSEPWVENYPDPHAYLEKCFLYYGDSKIATFYFVAVDGGDKNYIPLPKSSRELKISQNQYILGTIINYPLGPNYNFDECLKYAGISIDHTIS